MFHFRLITKTYMSNQLLVYMSIDASFPKNYLFSLMPSFWLTTNRKVHSPTVLYIYRSARSSTYLSSLFSFRFNMHYYLSTYLLVYITTRLTGRKKTKLLTYVITDLSENKIYLCMLTLSFRLTTKTCLSIQLFVNMPIDAPVHQPTCSTVYRSTLLLFYICTYLPVHQYICSV